MKKLILFFLFFYQFSSISQTAEILSVIISPINESTINVYTNVRLSSGDAYLEHTLNIEDNTIDLNICYRPSAFPVEVDVEHNILLDVTDLTGEYTLNINTFYPIGGCYITLMDSVTILLQLPLEDEIVLSNPSINFDNEITIYPNPVKDVLLIDNKTNTEITSIKLYDLLGRLVLEEKRNVNQIDVSSLNSGLLFVKIETDEGILTNKIIKE